MDFYGPEDWACVFRLFRLYFVYHTGDYYGTICD